MKLLVEDAKEKIDKHIQDKVRLGTPTTGNPVGQTHTQSYASALVNPPPHANPKLAAREGIKARQVMIEGIEKDSQPTTERRTQQNPKRPRARGEEHSLGAGPET